MAQGFREIGDAGWRNISLDPVEIDSSDRLAYYVGRVGFDVPTENGAKRMVGKYVDVYKLAADGSWKIHLTIYKMDDRCPRRQASASRYAMTASEEVTSA